jgi:Methylamine utilisation protein MauE
MLWMAQSQPFAVGAVLLWAGAHKLISRQAPALAARSALRRVVGEARTLAAYRAVGAGEVLVATLILLPATQPAGAFAAAALCLGFLVYLGYARATQPDSSCGCMSLHRAPITWRSFARTGLLLLASLAASQAGGSWTGALTRRPLSATALLIAEAYAVVALSPELDRVWLLPLRRLRVRLRHPLSSLPFEIPLDATLHQLHRSQAYQRIDALLNSDVQDSWDADEWRIIAYAARYENRPATAVFAVPRLRYEPDAVRLAVIDEADQSILLALQPEPAIR